jgi:uncharacterized protein YcfL
MKALLPATLLILAAACRSTAPAHGAAAPPDPRVELLGDPGVEDDLETLDAHTSGAGASQSLEFVLRNKSAAKLEFAFALEWFDAAGARIAGSARAWTPMSLDAGASCAVQVAWPTPDASSWRLRAVRPGTNTLTQGVSR